MMRESYIALFTAVALLVAGVGVALVTRQSNQWRIEVVDNSGDVGMFNSLALDSSGNPT